MPLTVTDQNYSITEVVPQFPTKWVPSIYLPPAHYSSPEFVQNFPITCATDIFSFGSLITSLYLSQGARRESSASMDAVGSSKTLSPQDQVLSETLLSFTFAGESIEEYISNINKRVVNFPAIVSNEMRQTLLVCLNPTYAKRPNALQLSNAPGFTSLEAKVLKYMDNILTKDLGEKWNFFKGLSAGLSNFSLRLRRKKFLPILGTEVIHEPRFTQIILPLIFSCSEDLEIDEFEEFVILPLSKLVVLSDPPEVPLALINHLPLLIANIDSSRRFPLLFPILNNCLLAENLRCADQMKWKLKITALQQFPKFIQSIREEDICSGAIPLLLDVLTSSNNTNERVFCVKALLECLPKMPHSIFGSSVIPTLRTSWKNYKEPEVGEAIIEILEAFIPSGEESMIFVAPFAADMIAHPILPPTSQMKLIRLISASLELLQKDPPKSIIEAIPHLQSTSHAEPSINAINLSEVENEKEVHPAWSAINQKKPEKAEEPGKRNSANKDEAEFDFAAESGMKVNQTSPRQTPSYPPSPSPSPSLFGGMAVQPQNQNAQIWGTARPSQPTAVAVPAQQQNQGGFDFENAGDAPGEEDYQWG